MTHPVVPPADGVGRLDNANVHHFGENTIPDASPVSPSPHSFSRDVLRDVAETILSFRTDTRLADRRQGEVSPATDPEQHNGNGAKHDGDVFEE